MMRCAVAIASSTRVTPFSWVNATSRFLCLSALSRHSCTRSLSLDRAYADSKVLSARSFVPLLTGDHHCSDNDEILAHDCQCRLSLLFTQTMDLVPLKSYICLPSRLTDLITILIP